MEELHIGELVEGLRIKAAVVLDIGLHTMIIMELDIDVANELHTMVTDELPEGHF